MNQFSAFQNLGEEDDSPKATPVHHEAIEGPLRSQLEEHDSALKGYMGRLANGETLHPDEYADYEGRIREKSQDSMLYNRLQKQHGVLKRRGNIDMSKHRGIGTREKASELLNEYGGGSQ